MIYIAHFYLIFNLRKNGSGCIYLLISGNWGKQRLDFARSIYLAGHKSYNHFLPCFILLVLAVACPSLLVTEQYDPSFWLCCTCRAAKI